MSVVRSWDSRALPRRGLGHSIWAARILWAGPAWRDVLTRIWPGLFFVLAGCVLAARAHGTAAPFCAFMGVFVGLPILVVITWSVEMRAARALALFQLLPQRARPLQLLLWPMRFFALGAAVALTFVGHFPPLGVVILTSLFWWAISAAHWAAGFGGGGVTFAFLIVWIQGGFVSAIMFEDPAAGALPAAAVWATTFALLALLIPQKNKVADLLSRSVALSSHGGTPPARAATIAGAAPAQPPFVVEWDWLAARARPRRRFGTTFRVQRLAESAMPGMPRLAGSRWMYVLLTTVCGIGTLIALADDSVGWMWWIQTALMAASMASRTSAHERLTFFLTRPISRLRVFVATMLPGIGMALLLPVEELLITRFARAKHAFFHASGVSRSMLEMMLGVSPHDWVRTNHGYQIAVTPDLLGRFYREGIRTGLISLTLVLAGVLTASTKGAPRRVRWLAWGLGASAFASAAPYFVTVFGVSWWPPPPLWLAALCAALAAAVLYKQVYEGATR